METIKPGPVIIVGDDSLPQAKEALFRRTVQMLKQYAEIIVISPLTTEVEMLNRLQNDPPILLLVPRESPQG